MRSTNCVAINNSLPLPLRLLAHEDLLFLFVLTETKEMFFEYVLTYPATVNLWWSKAANEDDDDLFEN